MITQEQVDLIRNDPVAKGSLLIGGDWVSSRDGATLDVESPINGHALTTIADAGAADVDLAVTSARAAFDSGVWSRAAPLHRKKVLNRIADLIERDQVDLAVLGSRDNGTEIAFSYNAEPGSAAATFRYYAEAIDKMYGQIAPTSEDVLALVHREAIGVVGAIVPWNFPLMIGAWKLAAALSVGNSVVLKPAETASLTLLKLAAICLEAGLPEGVLNVVTGQGGKSGEALGLHMDVDVLTFTGSGGVGRRLLEYSAASNLKRVYLELGGKSPNIVFSDAADLDAAAMVSCLGIFRNSGQVCVSGSRLLVQESIQAAFVEKLVACAQGLKLGDPLDLTTQMGAVNSAAQLSKNLAYAAGAVADGADLRTGGAQTNAKSGGYYMAPTIFDNVAPSSRLACDEVFGPILSVIPFKNEEDAVRIANSTEFGLASAVWTADLSKAHRMVRQIRAGVVHVNTYGGADLTVPLGGHGQSGNGYDRSLHALDKFTNLKSAWIKL